MTLNQFYDDYTRKTFKQNWNVYCSLASPEEKEWLKKKLKQIYKQKKEKK